MGKKIFISYKYSDSKVEKLPSIWLEKTTARHYVDELQSKIQEGDHINKGENDDESMESLADSTIGSKLGDKIFDSTVTIVLISKGMKDDSKPEKEQWIPWEISYSLKEQSRQGTNSKTNAILGVVLPDTDGTYDWYYRHNPGCNSITHFTNQLFTILRENMFNIKKPETRTCNGTTIYEGESSYIKTVKWDAFINNINWYIEKAVEIWRIRDQYDIKKIVK